MGERILQESAAQDSELDREALQPHRGREHASGRLWALIQTIHLFDVMLATSGGSNMLQAYMAWSWPPAVRCRDSL